MGLHRLRQGDDPRQAQGAGEEGRAALHPARRRWNGRQQQPEPGDHRWVQKNGDGGEGERLQHEQEPRSSTPARLHDQTSRRSTAWTRRTSADVHRSAESNRNGPRPLGRGPLWHVNSRRQGPICRFRSPNGHAQSIYTAACPCHAPDLPPPFNPRRWDPLYAGDRHTPLEVGGADHRRRPGRPHRPGADRDPGRGHDDRVRLDVLQERDRQDGDDPQVLAAHDHQRPTSRRSRTPRSGTRSRSPTRTRTTAAT